MDVGVDTDDDIDHLAQIGQTVHAFSPSSDGTWFRSGTEARQDCDETHLAPLTPGGQAPDQASSSNRAGAGDHERTGRNKAQSQSFRGSHSRSPTTAQHLQAALAILTVIPAPAGVGPTRGSADGRLLKSWLACPVGGRVAPVGGEQAAISAICRSRSPR